jgi:DNA-binding PadR family transcriptional regulator
MDDALSFLPLSTPQFQILLALSDTDRHGYGIIQEIVRHTGGATRVGTGTLYTAIAGLVDSGLMAESPRKPAADHDQRRRYYRLTALGRRVLDAEARRLEALLRQARSKGVGSTRRALGPLSRAKP